MAGTQAFYVISKYGFFWRGRKSKTVVWRSQFEEAGLQSVTAELRGLEDNSFDHQSPDSLLRISEANQEEDLCIEAWQLYQPALGEK